ANIDYTIVRPAILTNQPAQQKYRILRQLQGIETGSISRQDVAHFIVSIAEQKAYIKQVVTLSD
ncbi:MAG: NAD(P)H-binding protein, partial [Gammaproteobacteria bacterium]